MGSGIASLQTGEVCVWGKGGSGVLEGDEKWLDGRGLCARALASNYVPLTIRFSTAGGGLPSPVVSGRKAAGGVFFALTSLPPMPLVLGLA